MADLNSAHAQDKKLWPVFYRMSKRGMLVDLERMADLRQVVTGRIEEQVALIEEFAGEPIDPASPKSIGTWMKKEGLGTGHTNKDGLPSTGEQELKLVNHPACDAVLEWRGLSKLINTFIDPTVEIARRDMFSPTLGCVHPRWRLTVVKSGRVACEDPNLLAFPVRDDMGKRVRGCFVPRPGNVMISIDYSQLEPRIVAGLSGDEKLVRVYREKRRLYTEVANDLGISQAVKNAAVADMISKTLTLGILYGLGARSLSERLEAVGVVNPDGSPMYDEDGCQDLIDRWFATYSAVEGLVESVLAEARARDGQATTLGGRERFLPGLFVQGEGWPRGFIREEAERQAFNHRIQGTGMEYLKDAASLIDEKLPSFWMLLLIHDEIMGECKAEYAEKILAEATRMMHSSCGSVEIVAKGTIGSDWGSLKV